MFASSMAHGMLTNGCLKWDSVSGALVLWPYCLACRAVLRADTSRQQDGGVTDKGWAEERADGEPAHSNLPRGRRSDVLFSAMAQNKTIPQGAVEGRTKCGMVWGVKEWDVVGCQEEGRRL